MRRAFVHLGRRCRRQWRRARCDESYEPGRRAAAVGAIAPPSVRHAGVGRISTTIPRSPIHSCSSSSPIRACSKSTTSCASTPGVTGCVASPKDTRGLFLYRDNAGAAVRPDLRAGEYLLLEEVRSPTTGLTADADPKHRQVLLIGSVEDSRRRGLHLGGCRRRADTAHQSGRSAVAAAACGLRQGRGAALSRPAFPPRRSIICIIEPVTVARGNIAPVDHGRSIVRDTQPDRIAGPARYGRRPLADTVAGAARTAPVTRNPEPCRSRSTSHFPPIRRPKSGRRFPT